MIEYKFLKFIPTKLMVSIRKPEMRGKPEIGGKKEMNRINVTSTWEEIKIHTI
jgi:hypothetical protein